MNTQTKNSLLLLLCSLIWGTAFVAQSAGSGMGAYSFLAGRSWLAVLVLIPTVMVFDAIRRKSGTDAKPKTAAEKKKLLAAGFVCGTLLFAASAAQQIGITINPSTAKAGFLTAMYVVLVPVFGLFLGRKGSAQLWVSMVVAVLGLYLLCMKNGFGSIESSDWLLLSCAVLFSFQIIAVDHFSPQVDGVAEPCRVSGGVGGKHRCGSAVRDTFRSAVRGECAADPLLRHHVQRRGLHPADPGPARSEPRHCQPDHVSGKRVQCAGRLDAAAPEPFCPGSLWLRADLCCCGAGPAAAGNAAPGKKDHLTSWRAESRRHSCARQAASNTS